MKIIGITGLIGSGKGAATEYIAKKYGFSTINMGDVLREMVKKEGKEVTRDALQDMRKRYGNFFLAEEVVRRIKTGKSKKVIIDGIRRSEDVTIPKAAFPDMKLIVLETDDKIRFERLKKRGRENDPKDFKEFQRQENRENEIYDFDKTFSYANFTINNNGTPNDLEKEIDKIMKKV